MNASYILLGVHTRKRNQHTVCHNPCPSCNRRQTGRDKRPMSLVDKRLNSTNKHNYANLLIPCMPNVPEWRQRKIRSVAHLDKLCLKLLECNQTGEFYHMKKQHSTKLYFYCAEYNTTFFVLFFFFTMEIS